MKKNVPLHVGVIMDGNGRWAQKCGKSRVIGHIEGAKKVPIIVKHLFDRGVKTVSLYAFSEENFSRPQEEITGIFGRVAEFVSNFTQIFGNEVRLVFSGDLNKVGDELINVCESVAKSTCSNSPYTLNLMLNYGGRAEIIRAVRLLYGEEINEENFRAKLFVPDIPDPDLIIRTGGEKRLSGFMPYQAVYSELYFSDVLFPDITTVDIDDALEDYSRRSRRYGGISED